MRVFITGASGFIGSAITEELVQNGHQVSGLTHSNEGAAKLEKAGVKVYRGDINDLESLRPGVTAADGVIHLAYMHGFDRIGEAGEQEVRAIQNMGALLKNTRKPFLVTSVAAMGIAKPGALGTEDHFDQHQQNPRLATEIAAESVSKQNVKVSIVRIPQVHNIHKFGIITSLIQIAKNKGISAYVDKGDNRWAASHITDVAKVYRLVLEKNEPGRYHAVAEEGISMKQIAETIGQTLNLPVKQLSEDEAKNHFGPFAMFVNFDMSASSKITQEKLNWKPSGPRLLEDIKSIDM
jgi:nucleoside-diphosphate-sugar epimerase